MRRVIENLQHSMQLLMLYERETGSADRVWAGSARANILNACLLLEQQGARAEARASAVELILKAELALASISSIQEDLSFRIADRLLLEARVEIEAMGSQK
jgi:hypothetical protein